MNTSFIHKNARSNLLKHSILNLTLESLCTEVIKYSTEEWEKFILAKENYKT